MEPQQYETMDHGARACSGGKGGIVMDTIFGYTWDEIKAAQQGKRSGRVIDTSKPAVKDDVSQDDLDLLAKHGEEGLRALQYFGVLDRLTRGGIIKP